MMRVMLYEAAQSMLHSKKWSWLKAWAMQIARRRGMKKAIVALARRLAVVMHRIWVDGTEFRGHEGLPRQQHESRSGSNPIGEDSRSTQQWKDVPRGTMDEVSSHVRLNLPVQTEFKLTTRPRKRLFHLVLESHDGRALAPIPKRSTSP
jgi:hypothetical protein